MPKISVPQPDGEITLSISGGEPTTYKVSNGEVTVKEPDVARFLSQIDGSKQVGGSPAATTKES